MEDSQCIDRDRPPCREMPCNRSNECALDQSGHSPRDSRGRQGLREGHSQYQSIELQEISYRLRSENAPNHSPDLLRGEASPGATPSSPLLLLLPARKKALHAYRGEG